MEARIPTRVSTKDVFENFSLVCQEYFSNLPLHQMDFAWEGAESGEVCVCLSVCRERKREERRLFVDAGGEGKGRREVREGRGGSETSRTAEKCTGT